MKVTLIQDEVETPEITIRYKTMDAKLAAVIDAAKGGPKTIIGLDAERRSEHPVLVQDIYYLETVNGRTFINLKKDLLETGKKLYQLERELAPFGFCQINKSCLLNTRKLTGVQTLANSRLKGTLDNGEKLIITRTYIVPLRNKLREG